MHILTIYMKQYKTTMKAENELIVFCYKLRLYLVKGQSKKQYIFSVLGKNKIRNFLCYTMLTFIIPCGAYFKLAVFMIHCRPRF